MDLNHKGVYPLALLRVHMKFHLALWLVIAVSISIAGLSATSQSPAATPSFGPVERALRERITEFYSLLQVGRYSEAESYLSSDSKENFRNQRRSPFVGFEIKSVNMDAGGKTATVQVLMQMVPSTFTMTPIPTLSVLHWRLEGKAWCAIVPKPNPDAFKALFGSPTASGLKPVPQEEELKFKGHRYNFADVPQGAVKVARFPFKNVTDHAVTITDIETGCDCLQAEIDKKQYAPGESGELAIKFNSANYLQEYAETIVVKTDPGNRVTFLNVRGFVLSPADQAARASQKPQTSDKH